MRMLGSICSERGIDEVNHITKQKILRRKFPGFFCLIKLFVITQLSARISCADEIYFEVVTSSSNVKLKEGEVGLES